jgi:hypothetical protein
MNTRFKVFASYNILQYMCDFIHVLIFVTVSKCRKSPKLTNIVMETLPKHKLFGRFEGYHQLFECRKCIVRGEDCGLPHWQMLADDHLRNGVGDGILAGVGSEEAGDARDIVGVEFRRQPCVVQDAPVGIAGTRERRLEGKEPFVALLVVEVGGGEVPLHPARQLLRVHAVEVVHNLRGVVYEFHLLRIGDEHDVDRDEREGEVDSQRPRPFQHKLVNNRDNCAHDAQW